MKLWFVRWYFDDVEEYAFYVAQTEEDALTKFRNLRVDSAFGTYTTKELNEVDGYRIMVTR